MGSWVGEKRPRDAPGSPEAVHLTISPSSQPTHYYLTTVPIRTTSNTLEGTRLRAPRRSSSHRASGAPVTYHPLPLSARIIPYFFIARRMTWTSAGCALTSYEALSSTRIPIGGSADEVSLLA